MSRTKTLAKPQTATRPTPKRAHRLDEVRAVAERIGFPLLPWAEDVVRVGTEYRKTTGKPYRRRVAVSLPRQCGKSVLIATVCLERMLREEGTVAVYLAQSRQSAARRLGDMGRYLVRSGLDPQAKVTLGVGNEMLRLSNGSSMSVMSPSATSVHGESLDLAVLDEAFAIDPIVLTGVSPAMAARPNAQLWMISTAGTVAESDLWNGICDEGRADPNGSLAFTEYRLPEGVHPYEWDTFAQWHPGVGHTTDLDFIRDESGHLALPEFTRAYGNRPTAHADIVIPAEWVERSVGVGPVPDDLALAVDVSKYGAAIAAGYPTETGWHGDLVDYMAGTNRDWLIDRVRDLAAKRNVLAIAYEASGPAGQYAAELRAVCEDHAIAHMPRTGNDRTKSDMFLFSQLRDEQLTHNDLSPLGESLEFVGSQTAGDGWRFTRRKALVDPAPAIALSMAVYAAHEITVLHPRPTIAWG